MQFYSQQSKDHYNEIIGFWIFSGLQLFPLVPRLIMPQWLTHAVRMKTTKILSFIRAIVINVSALLEQPHYPLGL